MKRAKSRRTLRGFRVLGALVAGLMAWGVVTPDANATSKKKGGTQSGYVET